MFTELRIEIASISRPGIKKLHRRLLKQPELYPWGGGGGATALQGTNPPYIIVDEIV